MATFGAGYWNSIDLMTDKLPSKIAALALGQFGSQVKASAKQATVPESQRRLLGPDATVPA
eukprot:6566142-Lingulodinium_polyedra.AAC.1